MATRKKVNPSRPAAIKGRNRGWAFDPAWVNYSAYGIAAVLVLAGQLLVSKGSTLFGMVLSIGGLLLFGVTYFGLLDLGKFIGSPAYRRAVPSGSAREKRSQDSHSPKVRLRVESLSGVTKEWTVRIALITVALFLGIKGQATLLNMTPNKPYVAIGLAYYFVGVALFLGALWPWKREGLKLLPLAPRTEWTLFGLIMLLAAFLRIYKLGTIPSGIFFDMGFQGYGALRILHEGWRPFDLDIGPSFPSAPIPIYMGALWFIFFKNTQFNLNLFYVVWCLASFPLIYWTFRQLSGPRVALLTLFILAVMRWNLLFARNSFPPSLMPFFMFGTLSLLLYGIRTRKRWPFILSAALFGAGLYSYQSYQAFLLVVFLVALYECVFNWKAVKASLIMIAVFSVIFLIIAKPLISYTLKNRMSNRENELSIMAKVKSEGSLKPLLDNLGKTALMFNRRGDTNPRHNLQDHRELDDVTGVLFFFGFFYALARSWRRKYFYALVGFFVMSLPCLLTIDPAHSSRMYGVTAFVAFLAAAPLAALWARVRAMDGRRGEIIFLMLLAIPLFEMARENYQTYFVEEANSYYSWAEYSIVESTIGHRFVDHADKYDCYVSPRFYDFFTIDYLDYFNLSHVKRLDLPDSLAAVPDPGRGFYYGIEEGRTGVLETLKSYFPGGEVEAPKDPHGSDYVYFYRVPPEIVDKTRGLKARFDDGTTAQMERFPEGLPAGPFSAVFTGDFYASLPGPYRFTFPSGMSWWIGGKKVVPGKAMELPKGFLSLRIKWSAPHGAMGIKLSYDGPAGNMALSPAHFHTFGSNRGLKTEYFEGKEWKGHPIRAQWEPVINYVNGNDFPFQGNSFSVHWTGQLIAPETGTYHFFMKSDGEADLKIDHRQIAGRSGSNSQGNVHLLAGPHLIDVYYSKEGGWGAAMSLFWVKPSGHEMEVVPNSAFGEIP